MARLLLTPAFYIHFQIAHNQGHHLKVGTPEDPATARRDESIYAFFLRTIPGNYFEAWGLERKRLERQGKTIVSLHNKMVQYTLLTMTYVVGVAVYFGPGALLMSFIIGLIGILLLESVNYIEHYGLMRKKLPNGRYENVNESHSWNSDHALGRIFLYELTRHTDHHLKSTRPYEDLRHINGSPQLPYGYPASILLSYFPGLWKRHIHPVLDTFEGQQ
jgi:alkane 1-monooxygenase